MKEKIIFFLTGYSREKLIALILTVVIYSFAIDINEISRTYSVKVGIGRRNCLAGEWHDRRGQGDRHPDARTFL